jgi:uncharacterized protein YwgA
MSLLFNESQHRQNNDLKEIEYIKSIKTIKNKDKPKIIKEKDIFTFKDKK